MTAQYVGPALPEATTQTVAAAHAYVADTALRPGPIGTVGLELEYHLVDLAHPARRPSWPDVRGLIDGVPAMPSQSRVTTEPGGQLELSTPPAADVAAAIAALQADERVLQEQLHRRGYGLAALGADPARPLQRVNPAPRYAAMEQHFAAVGCARPGLAMMTATAALQINLEAGPQADWPARVGLIRDLGPILVAVSGCSPYLAGHSSGWRSMRQQAWHGIDHGRSDPFAGDDPSQAWADYALAAPVMLVRDDDSAAAMTERVSFAEWLARPDRFDRPPTTADLDYHLTTLFPPVRPRGFVELRCLDAVPTRWWPALAAFAVTLIDDPIAAERAAELAGPVRDAWLAAGRDGLADVDLRTAAAGCAEVAAARCQPAVRQPVHELAELLVAGRTPGDEVCARARRRGPLALLEEEAHAE